MSVGPVQYPGTEVPEHADVCLHVPEPEGVEQGLLVQHLISLEPGHKFDVTVPEQQPADIDTQTLLEFRREERGSVYPLMPPTLHVSLYEQPPTVSLYSEAEMEARNVKRAVN